MSFSRTFIICYGLLFLITTTLTANIDSLNNVLSDHLSELTPQKQIELYEALGDAYLKEQTYELSISHYENALTLTQENNFKKQKENLYFKIGQTYNKAQDYPKSIKTFKTLFVECLPTDPLLLSNTNFEISQAYQRLGNHELAYEYQLEALHQNEILKDSSKIARSLYQIGSIFFFQRNLEMAIDYYAQSLRICEDLEFQRGIFNCLAAIGGAYSRMEDTDNSINYNLKAYELAKRMDYQTGLAYSTHNLGVNYLAIEELETALDYLFQSLELKNSSKDKWGSISTLRNIGDVYRLQNQQNESIKYLEKALQISKDLDSKSRIYEVYVSLADYYKWFGDFEKSTTYLYKSLALKDTLINEATLEKMSDAKIRFEIQEREEALMSKDQEIAAVYNWVFIGSILTLLILSWLLFTKYKAEKSHNRELEHKNRQIRTQNEKLALANEIQLKNNIQIQEQNKQLEISNGQLQRFAFIASHDLKEPLRTIGSYSNLLKRRYHQKLDNDANDFLDYITSGVSRMYHLLNDVLDYSKVSNTEQRKTWFETEDVIDEVKRSLQNQIREKGAVIQVGNLPTLNANKSHLYQLFQNLVSNAIKFTSEGTVPFIQINCEPKGKLLQFSVSDNGIGLEMTYENKIFEIFQRLHGKHEFEGTGVGLAICKKIVEQYDGEIWVRSTLNGGSTFFFTLAVESKPNVRKEIESTKIITTLC